MLPRIFLCLLACVLSSCISFNTGARLDSIGKAEPVQVFNLDGQCYKLNGHVYKETMVEYMQLRPRLVGKVSLHDMNTCDEPVPADDATGAPAPELYLVRTDTRQKDAPAYIRAIDFDYMQAERIDNQGAHRSTIPSGHFKLNDAITLMPSLYEGSGGVLRELPTYRTTGNKLRIPLSVILTYGVDLPLTTASYIIGAALAPLGI